MTESRSVNRNTGPLADHTTNNASIGNYIYSEVSIADRSRKVQRLAQGFVSFEQVVECFFKLLSLRIARLTADLRTRRGGGGINVPNP